jgi:hypothetical protein
MGLSSFGRSNNRETEKIAVSCTNCCTTIVEPHKESISVLKPSEADFPRVVHIKLVKMVGYVRDFV